MPKVSWPPKQLPLLTSGNWDHWCVWQVHCPLFEWSFEETCWCVWWLQGSPVAPPASVLGCGQGKCCQHIGLCASLIWFYLFFFHLAAFNLLTTITAYHLPMYQYVAIAFRILVFSVRFNVPSVVQCYLVHWLHLVKHMGYDESTAWFHVQHCLKPLRPSISLT